MINWQEWVVGVLVVLCIARIIYEILSFFVIREKIKILVTVV